MSCFSHRLAMSLLVAIPFLHSTSPAQAVDGWYQWRGPSRDGQISPSAWPGGLTESSLSLKWSVRQGPSYSGPIVSADRVFVTETRGKKVEVVRALDRETGKQLWETEWKGAIKVPFFAASNGSWIRATPAYDGERLYVAGIRDVLACLNAATGKILWRIDFVERTGSAVPSFGCVSSPLVVGQHVFVQAGASFVKIEKLTGKIVWQSLQGRGGMYGSAFSSPVLAKIGGVEQFVVQTRSKLAGIDPADGKVLWSKNIKAFRGMNILTPTIIGDSIFTSSYGGGSMLLNITKGADGWQVKTAWTHRTQGYMSSPVVVNGHIYMHLRNQRFVCLEAKTGELKWTSKPFGKYWSLVANGDKILALDQRGELLLLAANPGAFTLIDRRRVARDSWAHVAVVGQEVFVRDLDAMKRFDWK